MQWSKAGGWCRSTQCRTELNAHLASLSKAQSISACTYCLGDRATTRNTFLEIWLCAHRPQRDRLALFFFFFFTVDIAQHIGSKQGRTRQVVAICGSVSVWNCPCTKKRPLKAGGRYSRWLLKPGLLYCKRRNCRTQINFVYLVLLAERTEFSSIWKIMRVYNCMRVRPCRTEIYSERKFASAESTKFLRVRKFLRLQYGTFLLLSYVINSPGKELREENEKGEYFKMWVHRKNTVTFYAEVCWFCPCV